MMPGYDDREIRTRLMVWWVIWGAILSGLVVLYAVLVAGKPLPASAPAKDLPMNLVGFAPIFVSIVVRWLVMPRVTQPTRAFMIFVAGASLAEAGGLIGMFLGGPYRDSLWVLGFLAVAQYVPFYAKKLFDPKGSGFIPNR